MHYGYIRQNLREAVIALVREGELRDRLKSAVYFVGKLRQPAVGIPAPILPKLSAIRQDVDRFVAAGGVVSDADMRALADAIVDVYDDACVFHGATTSDE